MQKVSVSGLVLFVTGANKKNGIGRALVEEAIARGAKKVYVSAREITLLEPLATKYPEIVVPVELDITKPQQILEAAQTASDTQVLINNAGLLKTTGGLFNYDTSDEIELFDVNYFGPANMCRAFIKSIIENGNGAIVNVASMSSLTPWTLGISYSNAKSALHMFTQAIREELISHNVGVFGVYPGPVDTQMIADMSAKKSSPAEIATRVFDGMEHGMKNITTDSASDAIAHLVK